MWRNVRRFLLGAAVVALAAPAAQAFQAGAVGPVSLRNGFPVWWQDDAGVRIDLCVGPGCPLADPVIAGNGLSEQIGFGAEAFWWMSVGDNGSVNLELAMEAAWAAELPAPGDQGPFARIRLTGAVSAPGNWTVTGAGFNFTAEATDDGKGGFDFKNQGTDVFGFATEVPPFFGVVAPGATQITRFYGLGGNVVPENITIAGPGVTQTIAPADFVLNTGRLFNSGNNVPPVANRDITATAVATPVTIDLTANDRDPIVPDVNVHGIDPRAVGLGAAAPFVFEPGDPAVPTTRGMATAQGGRVAKNPDGTVTYRPAAAFSGIDTFSYVVQDTGGCISGQATAVDPILGTNICLPPGPGAVFAPAQVIVTVEQTTAQATFRPKVQKWDIRGTSSVSALETTDAGGNPVVFTELSGVQEVPPRATAGSGQASVTLRTDGVLGQVIDYTLTYAGLTAVTQAHIHNGAVGANGPVNVFLCSNIGSPPAVPAPPGCPVSAGTVTGTLSQADFLAAGQVTTFTDLVAAIQAGGTYVNVHTEAAPGGEIRGQLGRNVVAVHSGPNTASPVLGVTEVPPLPGQAAVWSLAEKLGGVPSTDRTITIRTSAGNTETVPLKLK